jgi:outer membrane protein OmpA-like peptidoglycan-associated protein
MKCNPWRWLWGLIPILMLGAIAILGERGRIEADLASRTKTVLERNGHAWADVAFEGRDAVLSGHAISEADQAQAMSATLDTMGVRVVDNRVSLIAEAKRYEWSAVRRNDRIRLDGLVPNEKTRRDVAGMVKASFPALDIDDRMKLARGAPPVDIWLGGVGFGLKQLTMLREGVVDLEDTSLSVRGDAIDARSYRAVKSALTGQMPDGIRLKSEAVRPPRASPFMWSARRQATEVQLVGHVPSDAIREDLLRATRRLAPETKVVDRMEPASGAPDQFAMVATAILEQLGRLEEGTGEIRDKSASLNGLAATSDRAGQVEGAMRSGVLASFRTAGEIRHREPAVKTVSPYETKARAEAGVIALTGYVPDERARAAVLAIARQRFAGRRIRDELQLGAGQPAGWAQCIEVALGALQKLSGGEVAITGQRLLITGTTDAEQLVQSLPVEVRASAGAACDAEVRVTLDQTTIQAREEEGRRREEVARLEAERRAEELRRSQSDLERRRADEERRRAEAASARQQAEEERRRAEATARQQAEEERRRAEATARQQAEEERRRAEAAARQQAEEERRHAEAAVRQQAEEERRRAEAAARQQADEERRRAEAAARQQADEERRRAEAAARQQADEERRRAEAARKEADDERRRSAALKAAPPARPRTEEEKVVDVCQEALSRVVREGIINFSRASFDLDPASFPTLNKVADAANRCPSLIVEIEGHTDSEGTPERNQRLSDRRANSVREYLSRAGVEPSRLVAIGYGQNRSIADNATPEGRAMNRRIEFVVKIRQ